MTHELHCYDERWGRKTKSIRVKKEFYLKEKGNKTRFMEKGGC
jgi:hypothetical protein